MISKFSCLANAIYDGTIEEPAILFIVTEKTNTKHWTDGVTIKEVVRTLNKYKGSEIPDVTIAAVKDLMEDMAIRNELIRIPGEFRKEGCQGVQARYIIPQEDI